jgi:hypothetical protein
MRRLIKEVERVDLENLLAEARLRSDVDIGRGQRCRAAGRRAVAMLGAMAVSSACVWRLASSSSSPTHQIQVWIPVAGKTHAAG